MEHCVRKATDFKSVRQGPNITRNLREERESEKKKKPSFLCLMERLIFISVKIVSVKEPFRQSVRSVERANAQVEVVTTIKVHRFLGIPRYRLPSPSSSNMHGVEIVTP